MGSVSCTQLGPGPAPLNVCLTCHGRSFLSVPCVPGCLSGSHPSAVREAGFSQLPSLVRNVPGGKWSGWRGRRGGGPAGPRPQHVALARFSLPLTTARPVLEAGSGPRPLAGPSAETPAQLQGGSASGPFGRRECLAHCHQTALLLPQGASWAGGLGRGRPAPSLDRRGSGAAPGGALGTRSPAPLRSQWRGMWGGCSLPTRMPNLRDLISETSPVSLVAVLRRPVRSRPWPALAFSPCRYMAQSKHAEARELMCSGALLFFSHGQVSRLPGARVGMGGPGRGLVGSLG